MRAALLGALFAALVTLPGLGGGTLWDNSETAYGEVAREIVLTHDWVVLHLNGVPWFVQPPLYFWIGALFAKVLGVSALAMRLPSALATICMGGAIGYATARIAGTRCGIVASIVLSTSLMQAIVGRLAIMDALLDFFVAAAILWFYRALEPLRGPDALEAGKRSTAFLCGAAALGFGMLAKGPVAPVIVLLVIGGWLGWEVRGGRRVPLPPPLTIAGGIALMLAITLPWFVCLGLRVGGGAIVELIGHYTVGRYTGVIENQRGPLWYYVPSLILGFFPWIAFLPVGFMRAVKRARAADGSFARLAIAWAVLPFVFFSFAQTKLPNYIALEFSALAIVVALWFEQIDGGEDRRAAPISAAFLPLTLAAIAFAVAVFGSKNKLPIAELAPQLLTLGAGMFAGSLATVAALLLPRWRSAAPYVLGATSLVLVSFIAFVAEPLAEQFKPIPRLAAIIERIRKPGDVVAIRGVSGYNALVFYTEPGVKNVDSAIPQEYISTICPTGTVYFVTPLRDLDALRAQTESLQRTFTIVQRVPREALVRIDGRDCPHD
jgi:4-amino-4-deoxy-L-arabinose transferase-like glycosyltransferase